MIRFIFGYVLGRNQEARTGCAGLLLLAAIVVCSIYFLIVG